MTARRKRTQARFEEVAHTGDLAIVARAPDPESLTATCLLALTGLLVGESPVEGREERRFEARGPDREERLVRLMQDYLYAASVEGFLAAEAEVTEHPEQDSVEAVLRGEPFDPSRHAVVREIKAVTYHDLEFRQALDGTWQVRVVCDL